MRDDGGPTFHDDADELHGAEGHRTRASDVMTSDATAQIPSPGCRAVDDHIAVDRRDLLPVLAFFRSEIDQSALMLGDLAQCLSQAIGAVATASEPADRQSGLCDAAIALQDEDRVQQRLRDLVAALNVLEAKLAEKSPDSLDDLNQAIIDSLRLDETRHAFNAATGMTDALPRPSDKTATPSIGDVDLF